MHVHPYLCISNVHCCSFYIIEQDAHSSFANMRVSCILITPFMDANHCYVPDKILINDKHSNAFRKPTSKITLAKFHHFEDKIDQSFFLCL